MPDVDIDTNVTPSLHPQNILSIEGYDNDTSGYVVRALEAFTSAYDGLSKIHAARKAAASNPVLNDSARLLQVADYAAKQQNAILPKFDGARDMLVKAIAANEGMLNEPLKHKAERPGIANEVRQHTKNLSVEARNKFFDERLKAKDYESLEIVLGAPGYLSGLSDEERAVRTRMYNDLRHPEISKKVRVMTEALRLVETRAPLMFGELEKAIGADMGKVHKLRKATTEAEKAFVMSDGAGSAVVR